MIRGKDRGWFYSTKQGTFWLLPQVNSQWCLFCDQLRLGFYDEPNDATADIAAGRCWYGQERLGTETLGIPDKVDSWNFRLPDAPFITWPPSPPST